MVDAAVDVRLRIEGHHLPGRRCGPHEEVHVALQVGPDPEGAVPGDAASAVWETTVAVVERDGVGADVRGPAVHGRRGDRFAYLTWGSVTPDGFEVFRRAKLALGEVPALVTGRAAAGVGVPAGVTARVDLTGDDGMPRCARLGPSAVTWSAS